MSNVLEITDIPNDDDNYQDIPDNYEYYIFVNLAILYKLFNSGQSKDLKENLKKIKEHTNKKLYDNLCKLKNGQPSESNKNLDAILRYIKDNYLNSSNCDSPDNIINVEDKKLPTPVSPPPPKIINFTVAKDIQFAVNDGETTVNQFSPYKIKTDLHVMIIKNNYLLQLKDLSVYQYTDGSNQLKFKYDSQEISVSINDNGIISKFESKAKTNDMLFLILLYAACLNNHNIYNLTNKNLFSEILKIADSDEIFKYWDNVFRYFNN